MGGINSISIREIFSGKAYGGKFRDALEIMSPILAEYSHELACNRPAIICCDTPEIQKALEFLWGKCGMSSQYASGEHKHKALLAALCGLLASAEPLCLFYGMFDKPSMDMLERIYASFTSKSEEIRMMASQRISTEGTHHPDMSYVYEYALILLLANMFCALNFRHCANLGKEDCICSEDIKPCATALPASLKIGVLSEEQTELQSELKKIGVNTVLKILEEHGGTTIPQIAMRLCPLLFSEPPHPFLHTVYKDMAEHGKFTTPQALARRILFRSGQGAELMFSRRTCGLLRDELRASILSAAADYVCLGAIEKQGCDSELSALLEAEFGAWNSERLSPLDVKFEANEANIGRLCAIKRSLTRKRFAVRLKKYRILILPL